MEPFTIGDLTDIILDSIGTPQVMGGFEVDDLRVGYTIPDILAGKHKQPAFRSLRKDKEGRGYRSFGARKEKERNEDGSGYWDRRESKRPRLEAWNPKPDTERTANKRSSRWGKRPEAPSPGKWGPSIPSSSSGSHGERANHREPGSSSSSSRCHRSHDGTGSSSQSHQEGLGISNTPTSVHRQSGAYRNKKNRKRRRYLRMAEELIDKTSESEEDTDTTSTSTPRKKGKRPLLPVLMHPTASHVADSDSSRSQESRASTTDKVTPPPPDSPSYGFNDYSHSSDEREECPQVVALDCEMVGCLPDDSGLEEQSGDMSVSMGERFRLLQTGKLGKRKRGLKEVSEAGRCSIVDYDGRVLYDKYIRPNRRILTLRTFVSGITSRNMENAIPINRARQEILSLLKGKTVVAHDIRNDLNALDISIPPSQIRDTAHCRPLKKLARLPLGAPAALRRLASEVLGMQIQKGAHSSVEDARVCMKLFRKVENEWL